MTMEDTTFKYKTLTVALMYILPMYSIFIFRHMMIYLLAFVLSMLAVSMNKYSKRNVYYNRIMFITFAMYIVTRYMHWVIAGSSEHISYVVIIISAYIIGLKSCTNLDSHVHVLKHLCYSASIQIVFVLYQSGHIQILNSIPIISTIFDNVVMIGLADASTARYSGTIGSIELFAEYLTLAFVAGYGIIRLGRNKTKIKMTIALLLIIIAGLSTVTRSFLILTVLSFIIYIIIGNHMVRYKNGIYIVLAIGFGFILIPNELYNSNLERLNKIKVTGDQAFNRRVLVERAIELIPGAGVFGYGIGYQEVFSNNFFSASTHSLYFENALIAGYIGLVSVVAFCLTLAIKAVRAILFAKGYKKERTVTITYSLVMFIWVINQTKINADRLPMYLAFIALLIGLFQSVIYGYSNSRK